MPHTTELKLGASGIDVTTTELTIKSWLTQTWNTIYFCELNAITIFVVFNCNEYSYWGSRYSFCFNDFREILIDAESFIMLLVETSFWNWFIVYANIFNSEKIATVLYDCTLNSFQRKNGKFIQNKKPRTVAFPLCNLPFQLYKLTLHYNVR